MTTPTSVHELDGKVALVTGATSGIGKAAAVELAANGATVIVHGRDAGRGTKVVSDIENAGGTARFAGADLADPAAARGLAAEAGDVDILINNAGFAWFGPTSELDVETLDTLFAANVQSAYLLVAALAPAMVTRGEGVIINIASMAGTIGLAGGAAYGATKASLSSLARSWAAEYGPAGVRVLSVSPGPVFTEGSMDERTTALGTTTLLGRAAHVSEIAATIGFLASSRASYITGTDIAVDAGRTAV